MYMEKQSDGTCVWRCERAEHKAARKYEQERSKHLEKLFAKLQAEFEKELCISSTSQKTPRKKWTEKQIQSLQTGSELLEALTTASDPASFEVCLSRNQLDLLAEFRRKVQEERQQELQAEFKKQMSEVTEGAARNVVPLVKIRIAGCSTKDLDTKTSTLLTLWRPQVGVIEMLKEGKRFKIYNLTAGENRGRQCNSKTSLSATRSTRYQEMTVDDNFLDLVFEPREVASVRELKPGFQPMGNEVDIVGIVVHVSGIGTFDRQGGSEGLVQTVYLADSDCHICTIKFWGGLDAFGVQDLLCVKSIVSCTNLLWKSDDRSGIPSVTATDVSVFSVNPRESYLNSAVKKFKSTMEDFGYFMKCAQAKVQQSFGTFGGGITDKQNKRRYSLQPSASATSGVMIPRVLPQRRYSNVYNVGRLPVNIPQYKRSKESLTSPCANVVETLPTTSVKQEQENTVSHVTPTAMTSKDAICDSNMDKMKRISEQKSIQTRKPEDDDQGHKLVDTYTEISTSSTTVGDQSRDFVKNSANLSPDPLVMDPKLASRKALQKLKARKLLDYGIAPYQSALNSPIPDTVRKAFKPPSCNSPLTPTKAKRDASNASDINMEDKAKEPLTDVNADTVRVNLGGKLEEAISEKVNTEECGKGGKELSGPVPEEVPSQENDVLKNNKNVLQSVENTNSEVSAKLLNSAKIDSQDNSIMSDSSQVSSLDSALTNRPQRKSRRKRNRTESGSESAPESTSPANKRRSSLRLRKK